MDFRFLLAERSAIWSFGGGRGDPGFGDVCWDNHIGFRFLAGVCCPGLLGRRHRCPPWLPATTMPHVAQHGHTVRMPASPTDPDKDAALIVDGATGKVLYARNETAERHPASLTKMMTLYLLFDALKAGKVTMQTQLPV